MVSTARWLGSSIFPLFVFIRAYKKRSVNLSGAVSGFFVTFLLALANSCFATTLLSFFITSSIATKYRQDVKEKIEDNFKKDGQRSWVQVVCNAGMSTVLGIMYLILVGPQDMPIDFAKHFNASWLSIGVMSVFAFGNADTWASELGTVLAKSEPRLITTWKKVPTGTNGGVTPIGTILSTLGGAAVGVSHYITLLMLMDSRILKLASPQWPLILYGALAGLIGSLLDSLIGATLQYSGVGKNGKVIANPKAAEIHISGMNIISNHNVNLIVTVVIGVLMPVIASNFWPL